MRGLLAAVIVVSGIGVLATLLIVLAFNFLTLSPGRHYGPALYAGLGLNLLAVLLVIGIVYALLRRIRA